MWVTRFDQHFKHRNKEDLLRLCWEETCAWKQDPYWTWGYAIGPLDLAPV